MKKDLKAAITISLSWIFMAIIGTFFIVLAYNIISTYQENEEIKYDIELKQTLRNILNNVGRTAGIEENSFEPIGNIFFDNEIEALCVDGIPILSINGRLDANNQFLQNYPIFMTNIDQGKADQTYLAVESFRLPFKVTNMLAMVSKRNLIVFDTNADISSKMIDKFKKSAYNDVNYITQDFRNLDTFEEDIKRMNLNSIVFVTDYPYSIEGLTLEDLSVEAYVLQIEEEQEQYGKIRYITKDGTYLRSDDLDYFNYIDYNDAQGMITMATLSRPETFECSYGLIIDSLVPVYEFYISKAQNLQDESVNEQVCSSSLVFNDKGVLLGEQQAILYSGMKDVLIEAQNHIKLKKFEEHSTLYSILASNLKPKEEDLERFNCQYVY